MNLYSCAFLPDSWETSLLREAEPRAHPPGRGSLGRWCKCPSPAQGDWSSAAPGAGLILVQRDACALGLKTERRCRCLYKAWVYHWVCTDTRLVFLHFPILKILHGAALWSCLGNYRIEILGCASVERDAISCHCLRTSQAREMLWRNRDKWDGSIADSPENDRC